jgi:Tfp pilus assembly protein PilO
MNKLEHKKFDFQTMAQWPTRIKIWVIIITTGLAFLIGYIFYIKNTATQLALAESNSMKLNENLSVQQQKLQALLKQTNQQPQSENSKLIKRLNATFNATQLVTALAQLTQRHELILLSIESQPIQNQNNITIQPIHCVVGGNYQQLQQFIGELMHFPCLLILSAGKISHANSPQQLTFDMILQRYQSPTFNS